MGTLNVVDVLEGGQLGGELGQGRRRWVCFEPPFQGLVEAFDFALGLRVAGVTVLLLDA